MFPRHKCLPLATARSGARHAAVGEELVRARADFRGWWTPELREGVRSRFEEVLGGRWLPDSPRRGSL